MYRKDFHNTCNMLLHYAEAFYFNDVLQQNWNRDC